MMDSNHRPSLPSKGSDALAWEVNPSHAAELIPHLNYSTQPSGLCQHIWRERLDLNQRSFPVRGVLYILPDARGGRY